MRQRWPLCGSKHVSEKATLSALLRYCQVVGRYLPHSFWPLCLKWVFLPSRWTFWCLVIILGLGVLIP